MRGMWLLLLLLAAACAHAPRGGGQARLVEAESWSPLEPKDPGVARKRALAEAQRRAVEKAAGLRLSARIRVEAAVSVEQRIETYARGVIRSYEVLSELVESGFLKVRIRALVLLEAAQDPWPKHVKIAVAVPSAPISGGLSRALAARGFSMTGASDADLVLRGEARTFALPDRRLAGFHSCRARFSLEIVRAGTGEVSRRTQEASALDLEEEGAREKALEVVGRLAAEALAAELEGGLPR